MGLEGEEGEKEGVSGISTVPQREPKELCRD